MAMTEDERKALLKGATDIQGAPPVVEQLDPDPRTVLVGATHVPGVETEGAKLRRLRREQEAEEKRRLAAQQGEQVDLQALGQDAKTKAQLSEKLFKDFKTVDATWETDLDMDKWYGAKIAHLEASLEANEVASEFYTAMKSWDAAGATQANVMDLTGQLAKNKRQYEQITAGTHAWAKNPEGGWTFGEVKAELAEGLEELDATQTVEFDRLVAIGWSKEDATLLVAPLDATQTVEFDRLRAAGWSKAAATLRAKGQWGGAGEPAVEEAEPRAGVEYTPRSQLYQGLDHTPMYGERWTKIWGSEGEDVEYDTWDVLGGPGEWGGGQGYRPRPSRHRTKLHKMEGVEKFFGGAGHSNVAALMRGIHEEHGSEEAMNYLMDWRQDLEDGYRSAYNKRTGTEERYVRLIKLTKEGRLVDPAELRAVRKEYEEAYKNEVALHSVRQDLTAYMAAGNRVHLDPNSPAQRRIGKWGGALSGEGRAIRAALPPVLHNNYVDNIRTKAASDINQFAQSFVEEAVNLSEQEKVNVNNAIGSLMSMYSGGAGWIPPRYDDDYKYEMMSRLGTKPGPGHAKPRPIADLRRILAIEKDPRTTYEWATRPERRGSQRQIDYLATFEPSHGGTGNWARDTLAITKDLNINERQALVTALNKATARPGGKNQFMILAQRAIPSKGMYYPLRKAYLNAAKYDQLAVKAFVRMVEFGSSLQAEEALPEAAR